ncbi:uncharacterized protein TNCV_3966061 [Trichonephila clavipes]|nr:uncharacterized protein TNCV_3966061 [Trichonephila clavipes]
MSKMKRQGIATGIVQSCKRVGHKKAETDGLRIVGFIQTNLVYWRCQLKRQRSIPLSFEHHIGDSTIWLVSTPFEEDTWGGQGPPTSLPLPPTTREDLWLDCYLEYPHAAKALHIYKHPCLPRDSNLVPTAPQSASLTTIPVGRRTDFFVY